MKSSRTKRNKVLVVAAHPDDEVLGCGGTIAMHAEVGDEVHVLILAEGATGRDPIRDREKRRPELTRLAQSARRAVDILKAKSLTLHDFPDNRMDSVDILDVAKLVESHIKRVRPGIVYTHHAGDLNIDHRRVHEGVVVACRPLPSSAVRTLLFFEAASSTEWRPPASGACFAPNWFVDVSATLGLKLKALDAYRSEMRPWPHPRSRKAVEHLARWRGATAGVDAAEGFVVGRHLVD